MMTSAKTEEFISQCEHLKIEADKGDGPACIVGEKVFCCFGDFAVMPGHIYSEMGLEFFKATKACEYHFDECTKEPEGGSN